MKKILALVLSTITIFACIPSVQINAAFLADDARGIQCIQESTGTIIANYWIYDALQGKWFFTDENGYIITNKTYTIGGGSAYFDIVADQFVKYVNAGYYPPDGTYQFDELGNVTIVSPFDVKQELIDAYCGEWSDQYSQRCYMTIESENGIDFRIDVYWGNSASSTYHWVYYGTYDNDIAGIDAVGSCYDEYISDSGRQQVTELYAEGSALFYLSDGYMYWLDFKEFAGDDCYFARTMYY